jgi:hypothetical protein
MLDSSWRCPVINQSCEFLQKRLSHSANLSVNERTGFPWLEQNTGVEFYQPQRVFSVIVTPNKSYDTYGILLMFHSDCKKKCEAPATRQSG